MSSEAALSLARAILPDGRVFPGASPATIARAEALLAVHVRAAGKSVEGLATLLDSAAILRTGRRFCRLDAEKQQRVLQAFEHDRVLRWPLLLFSFAVKAVHFDDPAIYKAMGCVYDKSGKPEPTRWLQQIHRGEELEEDTLECDVVVIGTGAGGAVVGKELAERGYAVVLLEEGDHHRRDAFNGRAMEGQRFYRAGSSAAAVGNAFIPILMGRLVGGSTAINTGTCFRTPKWILDKWCETIGTDELSYEKMAEHFDAIETEIGVERAKSLYVGGPARVVARGCDVLGWNHYALRRNAPDCDGQGVCDFGCPTDARKSMNITYVPKALLNNAMLVTGMRVKRVILENRRAVGVEGEAVRGGKKLTVRARAVVLSGGAIPTPMFLLSQGIANHSGEVGRNLSLHPASAVSALLDERVEGYKSIPQGYCCDQFHRDGILLLGASAPLDVGANMFFMNGRRLMDTMESYDRVVSFGVMVEDEARGRVRRGPTGAPFITYFLGAPEVERLRKGMAAVAEIFHAAGARRMFPLLPRMPEITGRLGIRKLETANLRPWDFMLTSFHPLGTCRMGRDPKKSVVDLSHESHDIQSLFIVDGSAIPGPPAVNPQITIMAFAHRAAGKIAERLG